MRKTRAGEVARHRQHVVEVMGDLNGAAIERSRLVTAKASFLAVSAGILITAAVTYQWSLQDWSVILPLASSVLALGFASYAMRPEVAFEVDHGEMTKQYFRQDANPENFQRYIVDIYTQLIERREVSTKRNARAVSRGYVFLMVSAISLVLLFTIDFSLKG